MTHDGPARDLTGYGAKPPRAPWAADGARVAVNFCINYEEGAERSILVGDDGSEDRVSDVWVERRIGARDLNIESSYNYGARVGYWRLIEAFTTRGLPATVNLVGLAGELVPEPLAAMIDAGFDLQGHGWRWIDQAGLSYVDEREHIRRTAELARRFSGTALDGWYAGLPSINTRRIAASEGFLYDSDAYDDDLPYWSTEFDRPILVIPYSLDTNDSRFARREGYQTGDEFARYLIDAVEALRAEGRGGILSVGLHARLIGRPGRIGALHRVLDHVAALDDVWVCRRGDLARRWIEAHPPPG